MYNVHYNVANEVLIIHSFWPVSVISFLAILFFIFQKRLSTMSFSLTLKEEDLPEYANSLEFEVVYIGVFFRKPFKRARFWHHLKQFPHTLDYRTRK